MAIVRVLNTSALSVFFDSSDSGATLSLKTAAGLVTASASAKPSLALTPAGDELAKPWNFGAVSLFVFPASELDLHVNGLKVATARWNALQVNLEAARMEFHFTALRLTSNLIPGLPLEADAKLVFVNAAFDSAQSSISLRDSIAASAKLESANSEKIQLDWKPSGIATLPLPGPAVTLPADAGLSLLFQAARDPSPATVTLSLTTGQAITATSGFAWKRLTEREALASTQTPDLDILTFTATPPSSEAKVDLITFNLDGSLPTFFQFTGNWTRSVATKAFQFPFLSSIADQFVSVKAANFNETDLKADVELEFHTGALKFAGLKASLSFDPATFALGVPHETGIVLSAPRPSASQSHQGLSWSIETDNSADANGRVPLFVLATKDFHYQIQLAQGTRFVLEYAAAGDPIRFVCSDFALTEKGINLTAEITDQPARLNGINTKFSFHGTRLQIIENTIQDFTLLGSGPLPPALVGDATADISLQFQQKDNALTLVAAAAELKGTSVLEAKTTHFKFQVDALGLNFVNDNGFHLYFTISGSATYAPGGFDQDSDPLHLLSTAKIELVECPLTGDARVLAKHINFLVEFNEPLEFKFLGAFTFELRAIGFLASTEEFDGDAALQLTGQIMFSPEGKDTKSAKVDFHGMLIGAPLPGELLPRLHVGTLGVEIEYGEAFHLSGEVEFHNTATQKGFDGEGTLEIKGMPTIAASFSFLRVRLDADSDWVLAWFIFIEVRKVSFQVPVVQIFLREVGLGFGYRYTLTSIATADKEGDLKTLIGSLRELSRTAGDLSKRDRWAVDLEEQGEDPRWTIAFRAMFSQTSASSLLKYNDAQEAKLPCVFLFDAVAAIRSDLTFFMAARGWINTNYNDFYEDRNKKAEDQEISNSPIVTGYVIFMPRQKRLLAHVASNPEGSLGTRPEVPDFVKSALADSQFSATLLIEPGLFHFELGWPNMLRWTKKFGDLSLEFRGGFIFRVTTQELVVGISFQARASLDIKAEINLVFVGARLEAALRASLGARLLAVTSLTSPDDVAVYAAIGVDVRIAIRLVLWVGVDLGFVQLTKEFSFSFSVGFTAGLEIGVRNGAFGLQGAGTIFVEVMGHSLHFAASFASNADKVVAARERTRQYLNIGLEATDVDEVPAVAAPDTRPAVADNPAASAPLTTPTPGNLPTLAVPPPAVTERTGSFQAPNYVSFVMSDRLEGSDSFRYFLLMPKGEGEQGFLPAPPPTGAGADFTLTFPQGTRPEQLQRFNPTTNQFEAVPADSISWTANWESKPVSVDSITLADYLKHAFVLNKPMVSGATGIKAVGDPELLPNAKPLEDDRVHNPTDSSFEAAVRGAVEQFRGSPMFKRDPNVAYDKALGDAFNPATTAYTRNDVYDPDSEHAHHFRGAVVHDLVQDFRSFVEGRAPDTAKSIPFQMGLVFRMPSRVEVKPWLSHVVAEAESPKIQQRIGTALASEKLVATFNIEAASFEKFPPRFERVRQYTSSNTIAVAWDLTWDKAPAENCTACQKSPEHHLLNYEVRRRALDGREREVFYTVKNASALNKNGNTIEMLRPRFKLVDNFSEESLAEQAALPVEGRSYLYTITPRDVAGNAGRPLTLVATRFPDEPPAVPANGELTVLYNLAQRPAIDIGPAPAPQCLAPAGLDLTWSDPVRTAGPAVPVAHHRLVFRRNRTLPLGSYGQDAATSQTRRGSLPTSNARALPTDIKIDLNPAGSSNAKSASISLADLRGKGIFADEWRPEAWTVFFQTESANGVPSALASVKVLLRFEGAAGKFEERHPGDLEFIPNPIQLPLLPPQDQNAVTGIAHFPMPSGTFKFAGVGSAAFQAHPEQTRLIRFRWNQGPSGVPGYPLPLHAGFSILELNIDANTSETFTNRDLLANALWDVQEIRMVPAADLLLAPGNTLATSQWEAWYPSTMRRISTGSWYSWRESYLEWPAPRDVDGLKKIVEDLRAKFVVDLQTAPPIQEMDLAGLMQSTAPGPDPYGWGILQRFGLSLCLSLREQGGGNIVSGNKLLDAVKDVLPATGDVLRFLHVELLFQPSSAVSLAAGQTPPPASLLGIVQLSLRPAIVRQSKYLEIKLKGMPAQSVTLTITPKAGAPCTVLNLLDPAAGELEITTATARKLQLPLTGELTLLVRSTLEPDATATVETGADAVIRTTASFEPTDRRASFFTAPVKSLATATGDIATQWRNLKTYCESLNSSQTDRQKAIVFPTAPADLEKILPDVVAWTARFFDHAADVDKATGKTLAGPWAATAYPRSTAQVFTSPDESGRLTHDYLLTDKFAHNFRYYIRPFGRYDLLWRSLLQSPVLFSRTAGDPLPAATPEVDKGALDVVLDRTQPVSMPVVLRSARLDPPSVPGQPAAPGAVWEVIVAKHPEQALAERNQTAFRQLSFRGITFTLLRNFAFDTWKALLEAAVGNNHVFALRAIDPVTPDLPTLPSAPDHLNLAALSPDDARSLELASRLGSFQQGAMVLQWQGLPFYYKHRLLLVAQTSSTVSDVNDITQQNFEYRSPSPACFAQGTLSGGRRQRRLRIPLNVLWDALPDQAQSQWPDEEPDTGVTTTKKPGAMPDLEVIYQIVYIANGNIEVQAELFFDFTAATPVFRHRQLGRTFQVEGSPQLSNTHGLSTSLAQITKVQLQHTYALGQIPEPTRSKIQIATSAGGSTLTTSDLLQPSDVVRILLPEFARASTGLLQPADPPQDAQAFFAWRLLFDEFYAVRRIGQHVDLGQLASTLDFVELTTANEIPAILADRLSLIPQGDALWNGTVTASQIAELRDFASRLPSHRLHKASLQDLAIRLENHRETISFPYLATTRPLPGAPLPAAIQGKLTIEAGDVWTLRWNGVMGAEEVNALRALPGDSSFQQAIRSLIETPREDASLPFQASATASAREAARRLTLGDLTSLFSADELAGFQVTGDDAPDPAILYNWEHHRPLVLPAEIYKERVRTRFLATDPSLVEAFAGLIDRVDQRINALGTTAAPPAQTPVALLRCRGALSTQQADQLKSLTNNDPGVLNLLRDIDDRRVLDNIANDWFSSMAVSAPVAATVDGIDFPEPGQCTLVWTGAMSPQQRTALENLRNASDAGFAAAIDEILASSTDVRTGSAPTGLDQVPAALRTKIEIQSSAATHDAIRWIGPDPILDSDVDALKQWPAVAPFAAGISQLLGQHEETMTAEDRNITPRPRPRPTQAQLPAALASKLTIEPLRLIWKARLRDRSQLAMLAELKGDESFNQAIQRLIAFLTGKPLTTLSPPVFKRPLQSELPAGLRDQLLIGRNVIRYHGLMTAAEAASLKALYASAPDRNAIQRLFDASINRGLQGGKLEIRTRRGSAAPSSGVTIQGEPLS